MMTLYRDKSSTIENHTFKITGPVWMGSTTSPNEVVVAPLKPGSKHPGFSRVDGE